MRRVVDILVIIATNIISFRCKTQLLIYTKMENTYSFHYFNDITDEDLKYLEDIESLCAFYEEEERECLLMDY